MTTCKWQSTRRQVVCVLTGRFCPEGVYSWSWPFIFS